MKLIYAVIIVLLLSSCNGSKIKELESIISNLEQQNHKLKSDLSNLQDEYNQLYSQIDDLRDDVRDAKMETEMCELNYREYRYGNGTCMTRYANGDYVEVCGAENIIDFLNSHYRP